MVSRRSLMADQDSAESLATEIRNRCRGVLRLNEPMAAHTHFGLGGPADLFFLPADAEDLDAALPAVLGGGMPVLPLGGGTNLLVRSAGFRGLVICQTEGAGRIEVRGDQATVQAGASLQVLSRQCHRAGRSGLEFGCGIPGTVGGAIKGNAGAWGGETMGQLMWLAGVDLESGASVRLNRDEVDYGYRRTELPGQLLIVEAAFQVDEDSPDAVGERMDEMLSQRKESQPLWNRNAGCIFKNPEGSSAGQLIDQAGCKGTSSGGATVSDVHANFIVNRGDATSEDVLSLIDLVRSRVFDTHGVTLETEVRIVGEHGVENGQSE